jgi:hypothetical protein
MRAQMTPVNAQTLALKALGFLANSDDALQRLMDQSGLDVGTLKDRAGDRDTLASLLDFLLADEQLLMDFCDQESIEPKSVHIAQHMLAGA